MGDEQQSTSGKRYPYAPLGRRLRQLMERERMNQTQLAVAADLSISYPSKFTSGEKRPSYPVLRRIAQALKADIDELAHLAGYSDVPMAERPDLPGWTSLEEEDQAQVRALVARLAELNEAGGEEMAPAAASAPPTNPLRDRDQVELEAIVATLPVAGRAALLDTARALQSMAHALDEPSRPEPGQQERTEGRGTA